jgi:hypothetical protein
MKYTTILSLLFTFLILHSNIISIHSKISRVTKKKSLGDDFEPYTCIHGKAVVGEEANQEYLDFFSFFVAFIEGTEIPVVSHVAMAIGELDRFIMAQNKCGGVGLRETYLRILQCKEVEAQKVAGGLKDLVGPLSIVLGAEEKLDIKGLKTNPKALCKKITSFYADKKDQYTKGEDNTKSLLAKIEKYIESGDDFATLKRYDWFDSDNKHLVELIYNPEKPNELDNKYKFLQALSETKVLLKGEEGHHSTILAKLSEVNMPDCSDLPESIDEAAQQSFMMKVKATFQAVKFLAPCSKMAEIFKGAIGALAGIAITKIVEILTDLMGLFVIKILKIVWALVKLLYYIGQAIAHRNDANNIARSEYWGKAAGTGVRVVMILLGVGRKKMKRKLF